MLYPLNHRTISIVLIGKKASHIFKKNSTFFLLLLQINIIKILSFMVDRLSLLCRSFQCYRTSVKMFKNVTAVFFPAYCRAEKCNLDFTAIPDVFSLLLTYNFHLQLLVVETRFSHLRYLEQPADSLPISLTIDLVVL